MKTKSNDDVIFIKFDSTLDMKLYNAMCDMIATHEFTKATEYFGTLKTTVGEAKLWSFMFAKVVHPECVSLHRRFKSLVFRNLNNDNPVMRLHK